MKVDLDALEERCLRAGAGPAAAQPPLGDRSAFYRVVDTRTGLDVGAHWDRDIAETAGMSQPLGYATDGKDHAEFHAHARTNLPAIIPELRAARDVIETVRVWSLQIKHDCIDEAGEDIEDVLRKYDEAVKP